MKFSLPRLLSLLLVAAACDSTSPTNDLESARRQWVLARPASYDFTVQNFCFCVQQATQPVTISVRNGVVVRRVYGGSGLDVAPGDTAYFPDIDGYFGDIEAAVHANAHTVDVLYDSRYGFPSRISIDYALEWADDEYGLSIQNFTVR